MATVINNPPATTEGSNGMGMVVGIILFLILAFLLIFYGAPYLTNSFQAQSPTVSVPDKIDVNVNTPQGQ